MESEFCVIDWQVMFGSSTNDPQNEFSSFFPMKEEQTVSKKRNNQNSARKLLRILGKVVRKNFKKTYKIQQFGLQDRRQLFAIFRAAILQEKLTLLQETILSSEKALIEELDSGILSNKDKNYKTACLAKYLCSLKEEDLKEQNIGQSLETLFMVGQIKSHKKNEKYLVENYLKYEQKVWVELLE